MRVIVVGTGIVGASAAFHLADAGADVIVIDRAHTGKATLAGAGIICPWPTAATDAEFVSLYVAGAAALEEIVDRLGDLGWTDTGYRRVGAIVLAIDEDELAVVERRLAPRAAGDPIVGDVRRISGVDAQAAFPPLRDDLSALWIEGGARLDGRAMATTLLAAAELEPLRGLAALDVDGDRVVGVELDGRTIDADAVVVAGGAWTNELLEPYGISVDVEPQKGQIVHLRVAPGGPDRIPTGDWPSVLPPGPHYLLAFDDDRVVAGATRETGSGFDTEVTATGRREVLDAARRWAPGLDGAEVIETRVGLRPFAPDGRPTIGPAPGIDGLWVATGMGPTGLTIGPLAGRQIAHQILA